ncbi:MAG: hypothetical protein IJJ28_04070, partial [Lentisphaeria bacterium]|nr:hypothetical protein [Lentisphaeria bacterium]
FATAVLAGAWLSIFAFDFYRDRCECAVMRLVRPDGTRIVDADGVTWIFDHGPRTFGGWNGIEAKPGMKFEKRFAGGGPAGTMRIKVFATCPGVFLTTAGAADLKAGENDVDLVALKTRDGWFAAEILDAPPGTALAADLQRDYGRTRIDGERSPGELVARLAPVL